MTRRESQVMAYQHLWHPDIPLPSPNLCLLAPCTGPHGMGKERLGQLWAKPREPLVKATELAPKLYPPGP